jgi:hypothetical protein
MLIPLAVAAVVGLVGLLAALQPDAYTRYFLTDSQRERLAGHLKTVSLVGWFIFGTCLFVFAVLALRNI